MGRERRLVRRLQARDRDAARELIHRFHADIYRYLLFQCRNRETAEDLVQETFATVWDSIVSFRHRSSLSTWIHSIARNHFLQGLRRKRSTEVPLPLTAGDPPDAPEDRPDERLFRSEREERLRREVDRLPEDQREVILLHYVQDLSLRTVARVLGIPAGTVKSRVSSALKDLRRSFAKGEKTYEHQEA